MILDADDPILKEPYNGCKVALFFGQRLIGILRDDIPTITFPDTWDMPGGGREDGETPLQTVRREVEEELALVVPEEAFVWQRRYPAAWKPGNVWFFVAHMPPQSVENIVFGDEGQEWRLFTQEEFVRLPKVVPAYEHRLNEWNAETGGLTAR